MPWQQTVVDVALEVDENGRFVYQLVLVTVPRQSGKTTLFGSVLDHRAIVVPRARCWYTMQTQKDAVDWLINEHWPLVAPFGGATHLRQAAGSEHIRWRHSGGLVRPFPPTPAGLHSKVSDLVVVDECWSFDLVKGQQLDQAIVPTQATKESAQVWKVSTAGDASSVWWLGTVEQGRAAVDAGRTDGVAYFEWSCPDGLDPTDPVSWPEYHPAYGRTIGADAMSAALELLGPDEFARAYGNRWVSTVARVVPLERWRAVQDPDQDLPTVGRVALGFDVSLDAGDAAVVAAWRDPDGTARLEVAAWDRGMGWVPDRVADLISRWSPTVVAFESYGPAASVADVLARRGYDLLEIKTRDYVTACSSFLDGLVGDPPAVRVRPHAALDAAAASAARRSVGDAWAWSRRQSDVSISAICAATVAVWAFDHAPADLGTFRIY